MQAASTREEEPERSLFVIRKPDAHMSVDICVVHGKAETKDFGTQAQNVGVGWATKAQS